MQELSRWFSVFRPRSGPTATTSRLALSLLPAAVLSLSGCDHDGCVSSAQAETWTTRAVQAEAAGRVREAWRSYKAIGVAPACGFSADQRAIANKERGRLRAEINDAYDAAVRAIDRFQTANGRLPYSLQELAADIPQSAKRALAEFEYTVEATAQTYFLSGRVG